MLIAGQFCLLWLAPRFSHPLTMDRRRLLAALITLHALSRLTAFLLLYDVIGIGAPGDVPAFYRPWAEAAAAGGLPYRDIQTPFSPLFPYLLAAVGSVGSSTAFVFFFLICDVIGFAVWALVAELWFGRAALLAVAVLYGANPDIISASLAGQDEPLSISIGGIGGRAVVDGASDRGGRHGRYPSLCTKIISALYLLAILASHRNRQPFLIGLAAVAVPILWLFASAGADLSYPFMYRGAANERWSPGNIYFLLSIFEFDIDGHRTWATAILSVTLLSIAGFLSSSRRPADLAQATSLLVLTFSLLSFKSWYVVLAAPFLAIAVARERGWPKTAVAALYALTCVNDSAWYEWLRFGSLDLLWRSELVEPLQRGRVAMFAALQIAEVCIKLALAAQLAVWCWRDRIGEERRPAAPASVRYQP